MEKPDGSKEIRWVDPKQSIDVPPMYWHKATAGHEPAKVIEIWFGDSLTEDDIERR